MKSACFIAGSIVVLALGCGSELAEPIPPPATASESPPPPSESSSSSSGGSSSSGSSSSGGSSSGGSSGASSSGSSGTSPPVSCPAAGTPLTPPFTLRKVSGDGQAISSGWPNNDPLVVEVVDKNGVPAAGQTVTFSPSGDAWAVPSSVVTDACGRAETGARGQQSQVGLSYTTGAIKAGLNPFGPTVSFAVTIFDAVIAPTINVLAPSPFDLGSGKVGSVKNAAIKIAVAPSTGGMVGQGVANVGVRLIGITNGIPDWTKTGIASCVGGTVLTNAQGIGVCDVKFDQPGQEVGLIVGGRVVWKFSAQVSQ